MEDQSGPAKAQREAALWTASSRKLLSDSDRPALMRDDEKS